jgi:sulfate adenylyltransferase
LREYYAGLKDKVEVKLQSHAEGSKM